MWVCFRTCSSFPLVSLFTHVHSCSWFCLLRFTIFKNIFWCIEGLPLIFRSLSGYSCLFVFLFELCNLVCNYTHTCWCFYWNCFNKNWSITHIQEREQLVSIRLDKLSYSKLNYYPDLELEQYQHGEAPLRSPGCYYYIALFQKVIIVLISYVID